MLRKSLYTIQFKDNGKFYLYNSQSRFFCELSAELYRILEESELELLPQDIIAELKKEHVIEDTKDLYNYFELEKIKFLAGNLDPTHFSLVIAPTTACNFDCPYCFEPKLNPRKISDEVLEAIIQTLKSRKHLDRWSVTWYGGEPLLALESIKKFYHLLDLNEIKRPSFHSIVTNGYLFNKEVCEFFDEIKINNIQITLDGVKARHNVSRCLSGTKTGTFDVIVDNILRIYQIIPSAFINIRVNIDKSNYSDVVDIHNLFLSKVDDLSRFNIYPGLIRVEAADKKTLCDMCFDTRTQFDLQLKLKELGLNKIVFPKRMNKGCMMQSANSFIIGPEGELYKCWNDVSNPSRVIGSLLESKLRNESLYVEYMNYTSAYNNICRECSVFPICEGGCGYYRHRNVIENCEFELCSSYKDIENLKRALLLGIYNLISN